MPGICKTQSVPGTATDPRAGVISQARLSLANLDTGTSRSTLTDESGNCQADVTGNQMLPARFSLRSSCCLNAFGKQGDSQ
jgi:hypothetical protein